MGILSGKRDFLNFESWIAERLETLQSKFAIVILNHMENKILSHLRKADSKKEYHIILEGAQIRLQIIAIIFDNLLCTKM